MPNDSLICAKNNKKDEFYTQMPEIQKEMSYYPDKFYGKVVYCNCDDIFESNFVKFFLINFNRLGLKELIASGYKTSSNFCQPYALRIKDTSKYIHGNNIDLDLEDIENLLNEKFYDIMFELDQSCGDFRSEPCVELLKECDIVVTNPPFSLFREYVSLLMKSNKKFLIIGNINALTYKDFFPLIKDNKVWIGPSITSGDRPFCVPHDYELKASGCGILPNGEKFIRVKGVRWLTNIDHEKRHQMLPINLNQKYFGNENNYPKYDEYDAINVNKVSDIPCDYFDVIGVPITFIDKYCPDQFEILNCNDFLYDRQRIKNKEDMVARPTINGKVIYRRVFIRRRK